MTTSVTHVYSNDLCYSLEKDYFEDSDVQNLLKGGVTPHSLLEATKLIKQKENSPLLKITLDVKAEIPSEIEADNIAYLKSIVEIACRSGNLRIAMECIEKTSMEDVMLKVQAPFSTLVSLIGSNLMFKWMCKYKKDIHQALQKIANAIGDYCLEAISKGTKIISLADPSGIYELLGEKRYKEFVGNYVIEIINRIEPYLDNALLHICPRTSLIFEKCGYLSSQVIYYQRSNYAETLIELAQHSDIRIVGHRCVNAENVKNDKVYVLKAV